MIDFLIREEHLIMRYVPEREDPDWLLRPLESDDEVPLSGRVFNVSKLIFRPDFEDSDYAMDPCYHFEVGCLEGGYIRMNSQVLGINYALFLHRDIAFTRTTFAAETNIPIFRGFNGYGFSEFHIGGDHPDALPQPVFEELLRQFPNTYELKRYAKARVSSMIRSYVPIEQDFEAAFLKYRNRKQSAKGSQPQTVFARYESDKFSALAAKIESMLGDADPYSEAQWQAEILQVIQLLYPKYVATFAGAPVRDGLAGKDRKIDFLLVDAAGYVDAIEIKKPFAECLVTSNCYRDNHVPMRELSGAVMQLEKYLYHLNRWGDAGEAALNTRYQSKLPSGLTIKIVNPTGMIILGRDHALTKDQRTDFEVIRRKYRNVVEIMTYDDLLRRLIAIRDQFLAPPHAGKLS